MTTSVRPVARQPRHGENIGGGVADVAAAPFDAPEPGDAAALLSLLDELAARGRAIRQQAAAARPASAAEVAGGGE